ncbi:MAG: hypothetical protein KDD45_14460 [Bdellovibrionales bacterium]|nr:hypothetical protein [Bdellovibrionales bacterium]
MTIFQKVLGASLILMSFSAGAEPLRVDLSQKIDKTKQEDPSPQQMSAILEKILNNIKSVALDFEFDITFSSRKNADKKESYLDIEKLNLNSIIQFKDDLVFEMTQDPIEDGQLKKIVPKISLNTKNMFMVGQVNVAKKSQFDVRFCNNYTIGNDYCDTADDTKILDVSINNQAFNEIIELKFKKIILNFEQLDKAVKAGQFLNYNISGSCESYKKAFDIATAEEKMVPVECSFLGSYSTDPSKGFKINFKYKNKK